MSYQRVSVDAETACWIWYGPYTQGGYGMVSLGADGRTISTPAHRAAWILFNGRISQGMELDHLCRERRCINPEHMEVVTHAENIRRGRPAVGARNNNGRKTHCPKGHPYEGDNLRVHKGRRACRTCARERARQWRRDHRTTLAS